MENDKTGNIGGNIEITGAQEVVEKADTQREFKGVNGDMQKELSAELTEEERKLRKLQDENERLRQEIERVRNLPLKERLYDKVNVSVRTLDIFIAVMIIFGIIVVVLGMR